MNTPPIFRALALLLACDLGRVPAATLRWEPAGGSTQWNDGANWKDVVTMTTGNVPNSAMFDALIPGSNSLALGSDITIGNLSASTGAVGTVALNGGGFVLTVVGSTFADRTLVLSQGTFALGNLDIPAGLTVSTGALASAPLTNLGVSDSDAGTLTLQNGGQFTNAGTFTVNGDSGINAGTGGGTFVNSGDFVKQSGTGISSISAAFTDMGAGTISNSAAGTLSFGGATTLNGSLLEVSGTGNIQFSGTSTLTDIEINLTNGGDVLLSSGTHTIAGTLTSDGDVTGEMRMTGGTLTGSGALNFRAAAPFALNGGTLGGAGMRNEGAFQWRSGTISGLSQEGPLAAFVIPDLAGVTVGSLGLTNRGSIFHRSATVQIGNGNLENKSGATYSLNTDTGSAVIQSTGGGTGIFLNEGLFVKRLAFNVTVFAPFTNAAAGTIEVRDGQAFLRGVNTIGGTIMVSRSSDANAKLVIGGGSLASTLNSPAVQLTAGGVLEFSSGTATLNGTLAVTGDGMVEQTAGTILVTTNPGQLSTDATSKVRLNGSSAIVQADSILTNSGRLEWRTATLRSASGFVNAAAGTVEVVSGGTPRLGDNIQRGQFDNLGTFHVLDNADLLFDDNSELVNRTTGLTNTFQLIGTGSIRKSDTSVIGELLINEGLISKEGAGGADITVDFRQRVGGRVDVNQGTLRFSGDALLDGGLIAAQNTSTVIEISGPATIASVKLEPLSASSHIAFGGAGITHTLNGTISSDFAMGQVRLTNGTFTGSGASSILRLPSGFVQSAGVLTGTLRNEGLVEKTGGTTSGDFTNASGGRFVMNSTVGAITGAFRNEGVFEWLAGPIGGGFTNVNQLEIRGTAGKVLTAGSGLDNAGAGTIAHLGLSGINTLLLESGAFLQNTFGRTYLFSGTAGSQERIAPSGAAPGASFGNTGIILKQSPSLSTISVPLNNVNGTIEVEDGTLTVSGAVAIAGGMLKSNTGTSLLEFTGGGMVTGPLDHDSPTTSAGTIRYRTQPYELSGTLSGDAKVQFQSSATVPTSATFELADAQVSSTTFTLNASATFLNSLNITWTDSTAVIGTGATFRNAGSLDFFGSLGNTITTAAGATGALFLNTEDGEVSYQGSGNLVLDRRAVVENEGRFFVMSDADIVAGGGAVGVSFVNRRSFFAFGTGTTIVGVPFDNPGSIRVQRATLQFTAAFAQFAGGQLTGGKYFLASGATLNLGPGLIDTIAPGATVRIEDATARFVNLPDQTNTTPLTVAGGLEAANNSALNFALAPVLVSGTSTIEGGSSLQTFSFQNTGLTTVNGTLTSSGIVVNADGGGIAGSGQINGGLDNAGDLGPGQSPGTLTINGSFAQQATGALTIEIGGLSQGNQYDLLAVNGPVTLGGTLSVVILYEAFGLPAGSTFTILTGSSITGTFATLDVPCEPGTEIPAFSVQYLPTAVQLTALVTLPEPGAVSGVAVGALLLALCRRRG